MILAICFIAVGIMILWGAVGVVSEWFGMRYIDEEQYNARIDRMWGYDDEV